MSTIFIPSGYHIAPLTPNGPMVICRDGMPPEADDPLNMFQHPFLDTPIPEIGKKLTAEICDFQQKRMDESFHINPENAIAVIEDMINKTFAQRESELAAKYIELKNAAEEYQKQVIEANRLFVERSRETLRLQDELLKATAKLTETNTALAEQTRQMSILQQNLESARSQQPLLLTQEELFAALGYAMGLIEKTPACVESTNAVVVVGEIRSAIGNKWNKPDEYAARRAQFMADAYHNAQEEYIKKNAVKS